ncbi:MAG: ATP synthase F1 subunit epsilon [Patescibacteria group bacterium]
MANPAKIKFKIVTPNGVIFDDEIDALTIPTASGEITVLPGHIPLISILVAGELIARRDGVEIPMSVSGGIVEVRPNNELSVLAETAERAEHIDLDRAEAARQRAWELMQRQKFVDDVEFVRVAAKLEKELARLRVGRKYRKLNRP